MLVFTVIMKKHSDQLLSLVLHAHEHAICISLWGLDYAFSGRLRI